MPACFGRRSSKQILGKNRLGLAQAEWPVRDPAQRCGRIPAADTGRAYTGRWQRRRGPLEADGCRETVGELQAKAIAEFESGFGRYGLRLYELARGIDHSPVVSNRLLRSISAEGTFQQDVPLAETGPVIRRLAEKFWAASHKEPRTPRTFVLKLKTAESNTLTRSLTPEIPPSSCEEFTSIALTLRQRVTLPQEQLYDWSASG